MEIKNKIIIVTGASSGIGKAAAELLASKGAKVALVARSEKELEKIAEGLPGSFVVRADMTDEASIKKMVASVKEHYGRIDVLVNNAGRGGGWEPVERLNVAGFRDLLELNVMGPIIAMQQVIPVMRAQAGGAIVNIGSGTVKMIREGGSVYPGTKVLLQHISRVARLELEKDGIVVSVIHPFLTKTNFFKNSQGRQSAAALSPELMNMADEPEKVAEEIVSAIEAGVDEIDMTKGKMR